MNVKIFGFEWKLEAPGIDITKFLEHLKSVSGQATKDGKHIFAITEKSGFYVGILLAIKDYKRYCQLKELKITAQELEEGTNFVDLNFFLIHPATGRGLYQYYFHSTSLNYFCVLCQYHYRNLKKSLGITKRGTLKYVILTRKENLIAATEKLKAVKRIEIEQVSYDFSEKNFSPLAKAADRIVERAVFWRKGKPEAAVDILVGFLKKRLVNIRQATIEGIDASEQDVTLKLLRDYDVYGEYDYDNYIQDVSLDTSDLEEGIKKSSHIKSLIAIAQKAPVKQLLEK
jgi:hypothetical protein